MTTSRDIARLAGVSQTTVSRVLNGSDKVRPDTRERVLKALEGYRPNAQARAMRRNRTDTIGVVASQITNPYFPELIEAIYRAAERHDKRILLWNDPDPDAKAALDGVLGGYVDGVCYASAIAGGKGVEKLMATGAPVVLINRGLPGVAVDQVTSDATSAGHLAARYFLDHGRMQPAMISGADDIVQVRDRTRAFCDELADARHPINDGLLLRGSMSFNGGYDAVIRLLDSGAHFDALMCGNDVMAFGALSALADRKLRVPEDVWVLGHDDLPMADWAPFSLTSLRQPIADMAEKAMMLLSARMDGNTHAAESHRLPVTLVPRGSTAHTPLRDPSLFAH